MATATVPVGEIPYTEADLALFDDVQRAARAAQVTPFLLGARALRVGQAWRARWSGSR